MEHLEYNVFYSGTNLLTALDYLNNIATKEGWELVSVAGDYSNGYVLFLKRVIKNESIAKPTEVESC